MPKTKLFFIALFIFISHIHVALSAQTAPTAAKITGVPTAANIIGVQATPIARVILMSWDGAGAAYVQPMLPRLPHLRKLQAQSIYSFKAQSEKPTITLPNHTSMVTGLRPDKHEVTWNKWDPDKGVVKWPMIFNLVRQAGKKSGVFATKEKFKHLRTDSVDEFDWNQEVDGMAKVVIKTIKEKDLSFFFVHCGEPDSAGHEYSWESPEFSKGLQVCDKVLGEIIQTLKDKKLWLQTAIIITADHGGREKSHSDDFAVIKNIPLIIELPWLKKSVELKATTSNSTLASVAAHLLNLQVPAEWGWTPLPAELSKLITFQDATVLK